MESSSAPPPPGPAPIPSADPAPAPGASTRRNWLALVSFLLSFSPLVLWGLAVVFTFNSLLFPPTSATVTDAGGIGPYTAASFGVTALIALASLVGSVSAIVTSRVALGRAKRLPGHLAWLELAQAGKMVGIVGIIFDCIAGPCAFVFLLAANYRGG